jgi:transglutaminase-like putative cysteine protease
MRGHRSLATTAPNIDEYLGASEIVDWHVADVRRTAEWVGGNALDPIVQTKRLFEWVRDEIPHSFDSGATTVTCRASDVLAGRTGICHAKAHLLAALLRARGIPAGFVYQSLCWDESSSRKVLHGLNGVYLAPLDRWVLLDARGNTGAIDARFDTDTERLAFSADHARGEVLYPTVFHRPAPTIITALEAARDTEHLRALLPCALPAQWTGRDP